MMTVDEVIAAIRMFALPEIEALLPPLVRQLPLASLLVMAENVAKEIEARNEQEAMKAAVAAADAQVDAAEQESLKLSGK